jgi:hypothetical protein
VIQGVREIPEDFLQKINFAKEIGDGMGVPENFRSKYPSLINDQYLKTWNN